MEVDTNIGLGATALQRQDHKVVAVTVSTTRVGLFDAGQEYIIPPQHNGLEEAIAILIKCEEADTVIPLGDQKRSQQERLRPKVLDNIPIIAPTQHAIEESIDKRQTIKFFEETNITIPETYLPSEVDLESLGPYPLIPRSRDGAGRHGGEYIQNRADLYKHLQETSRPQYEPLVRTYIDGKEYTTNVSFLKDETIVSIMTKRVLRGHIMSHMAWWTTCDPLLVQELSLQVAKPLDMINLVNVQYIVADGKVDLIEINLRFSGSSFFNVVARVNEHVMLVRDTLRADVPVLDSYRTNIYIICYQICMAKDGLKTTYDGVNMFDWRVKSHHWAPRDQS